MDHGHEFYHSPRKGGKIRDTYIMDTQNLNLPYPKWGLIGASPKGAHRMPNFWQESCEVIVSSSNFFNDLV